MKELESPDESVVAPVVGEVDEVDDEPLLVVVPVPLVPSLSVVPGPCPSLVASVPPVG
ncbi:hypothetical protein OV203_16550 [Nannocystis sp. ILAH1]|uniref:hypothetical protein n=1 Tax=unclassified Nannocystis TaxID=2627009 RepID=UPI002271F36C|nr:MULTISPECIES: hypothetical protein [unclassified Nannocystis]MCY0988747.1 hypothetical protein [Nannocystis sp. ILAH1]MCY1072523.1 hypothetical protein [Nannocystis sp. RBIL2]